jgi:plastocyanin
VIASSGHARRGPAVAVGSIAMIVLVLAAGCGDDGDSPSGTTTTSEEAADAVVLIDDVAFTNGDVRVALGGSVTFDNRDSQAHTATATDGSFDSGTIAAGDANSVTFDEAGSFSYICSFHPFMRGTVTVS